MFQAIGCLVAGVVIFNAGRIYGIGTIANNPDVTIKFKDEKKQEEYDKVEVESEKLKKKLKKMFKI